MINGCIQVYLVCEDNPSEILPADVSVSEWKKVLSTKQREHRYLMTYLSDGRDGVICFLGDWPPKQMEGPKYACFETQMQAKQFIADQLLKKEKETMALLVI